MRPFGIILMCLAKRAVLTFQNDTLTESDADAMGGTPCGASLSLSVRGGGPDCQRRQRNVGGRSAGAIHLTNLSFCYGQRPCCSTGQKRPRYIGSPIAMSFLPGGPRSQHSLGCNWRYFGFFELQRNSHHKGLFWKLQRYGLNPQRLPNTGRPTRSPALLRLTLEPALVP